MSIHSTPSLRSQPLWHSYDCAACTALNSVLNANVMRLLAVNVGQRSHYFGGRFENLYLPREAIPQLELILLTARQQAAAILQQPLETLRIGFWFNLMQQGDVTTPHTHDDDSELLSGTYYISVPPHSGELVVWLAGRPHAITPVAGRFIFFAPEVLHEVRRHAAPQPRLSVGFNIGQDYS